MSDIIIGNTEPLEAQFESEGVPITNATGVIYLRRNDDDTYYNGTTHGATRVSIAMTEVSETQAAGFWRYDFDTTGIAAGTYTIEIEDTSGNSDLPFAPFSIKIIENTVIQNQIDIEAKLDIVDTNVDTIDNNVDTSLLNQTDIENKIDVIDGIVDIIDTNVDISIVNQTSIEAKIDLIDSNVDLTILALDDTAAAAVGRAFYDEGTSILTLYKKDQPTVEHKRFNMKDKLGNPAGINPHFEKEPI